MINKHTILAIIMLALSSVHILGESYEQHNDATSCQAAPYSTSKAENEVAQPESEASDELISINYQGESLVSIIHFFAAKKDINIVLPQGKQNAIDAKITLRLDKPVSLAQAWDVFNLILDVAGYKIVPKKSFYLIVKAAKETVKEPAPIYVGTSWNKLPNNDQPIWYVHFLTNLKVAGDGNSEVERLLANLLPEGVSAFRADTSANALIIMAPSNAIRKAIHLIKQLDQNDFEEIVEKIPLFFTDAGIVADLFIKNIFPAIAVNEAALRTRAEALRHSDSAYFSKSVRVVAEPNTNSLLVIGRSQAVQRIKDFIKEFVDKEIEAGKSPYHVYQLRYLDAEVVAAVLQKITGSATATAGQSKTEAAGGGPERLFGTVKIMTDKPANTQTLKKAGTLIDATTLKQTAQADNSIYQGGNRLVIAASSDDWKQIKDLIYQLDQPQPQVLLEVLIADLTIDDTRQLGSLIRNPARVSFPNGVGFQAGNLPPGILPNSFANPITVGVITQPEPVSADLLRNAVQVTNSSSGQTISQTDNGNNSAAFFAPAGATVMSVSDSNGSTWGIFQLLKLFDYTKVISHPHIIATHNQETLIEIGSSRRVSGEASLNTTVAAVKVDTIAASTSVKLTPRISTSDVVNINVNIDIDDFAGQQNQRVIRTVITNANVHDTDILALGGFIRSNNANNATRTPWLEKIPLIGWLFKSRQTIVTKTNLTVFISPTIIKPRFRRGISDYTNDYVASVKKDLDDRALFATLRDPITKWFFEPQEEVNAADATEQFMLKGLFVENYNEFSSTDEEVENIDMEGNSMPDDEGEQLEAHQSVPPEDKRFEQWRPLELNRLVQADPDIDKHWHALNKSSKVLPRS